MIIFLTFPFVLHSNTVIWQEAELLKQTGGWSNESQHIDNMGSPYLLATGLGKPVSDAFGQVEVKQEGQYTLWVRCRDWYPKHSPGQFQVSIADHTSKVIFGKHDNNAWLWINGGQFNLLKGKSEIRISDLTGWWSRIDAIVLSDDKFTPANDPKTLKKQRLKYGFKTLKPKTYKHFDVIVTGGGPAGMGAALAAARNGAKVALIQDRPVLGGNSSSEIQVPHMGYIGPPPDRVNVTGIAEELFPKQGWKIFGDSLHFEKVLRAEKNLSLFLNTRATGVSMYNKIKIRSVIAMNVKTGQKLEFISKRFIDCTGHRWIGYYAGAEYRHGTEAKFEHNERPANTRWATPCIRWHSNNTLK